MVYASARPQAVVVAPSRSRRATVRCPNCARPRYPRRRFARPRRFGHHPPPARVQRLPDALHDLRARRVGAPDRAQARRPPRGVRSRQARRGPREGADPPAGPGRRRRRGSRRDRGGAARRGHQRGALVPASARWPWTGCASSTRSPTSASPASTRASTTSSSSSARSTRSTPSAPRRRPARRRSSSSRRAERVLARSPRPHAPSRRRRLRR